MIKYAKIFLFIFLPGIISCQGENVVRVYFPKSSPILKYGISKFADQIDISTYDISHEPETQNQPSVFILTPGFYPNQEAEAIFKVHHQDITNDGYKIKREKNKVYVIGATERGCLYGILDITEQLKSGISLDKIEEKHVNPAISFRAIKFNLPWSSYRGGPSTEVHVETCKDLEFWEAFLDMMVKNRLNALTLWNRHPFTNMIRAANFPMATLLSEEELEEWQLFWKALFKMAKNRGIETYMVNWNIVVSPEFAKAYETRQYGDTSDLVKTYTRESVTQLINEYEDLTGLGVTLADWMGNHGVEYMTPSEREDWIEDTFIQGIANANRKVKFIHRAVLAGAPKEMRRVIDKADLPEKTIVEVKFNWSHGHSSPKLLLTHANHQGTIEKDFWYPMPENYFIAWMIRNEDFFVLRWGDPEFIRSHIKINNHEYVDGYFVGSECYIPAKDYSHIDPHPDKTWKYAFEKQWLFYHLWGRLMYNPNESDEALAKEFNKRYQNAEPLKLLNAYTLASKVPELIATFYKATWDFTLYSEGFLSVSPVGFSDGKSPFISIEELIKHETLDPKYLNIIDYVDKLNGGSFISGEIITPLQLANTIDEECNEALSIINGINTSDSNPALKSELDDIATWCNLGFYFADKIRAGVALQTYITKKQEMDKRKAISLLEKCLGHWKNVIKLTADRYQEMPYSGTHFDGTFHWSDYLKDVEADIEFAKEVE
ncbi:hypothetical protein GM418_27170 [Maribellus comscasis]|uniref:Alpha glucuronidase N-terminal domain-containing protein n=1 Tax=Maribellus comscasis TaxID=2681766 RepID=A0A6I6K442_9BACT|nr:alpha-glucuronidase family glycosyl hydrolase [Maribellus comscasis]QGY47212.1 hypothetical protein GM418_27170 [Maribellus comscasis]